MKLKTLNKIRKIAKKIIYSKLNKQKRRKIPLIVLRTRVNFKAWEIIQKLKA